MSEKRCFIITPIGDSDGELRREIDGICDIAVVPVLEELGFNKDGIIIPHRMNGSGMIISDIICELLTCDLVIANLTHSNANVAYELGIRHGTGLPVLIICNEDTTLPFDLKGLRTYFYKNDFKGVQELTRDLRTAIPAVFKEGEKHNPVSMAKNTLKKKPEEKPPDIPPVYDIPLAAGVEGRLQYYTQSGTLYLQGNVSIPGGYMRVITTLPCGYRPRISQYFVAHGIKHLEALPLEIQPNGEIVVDSQKRLQADLYPINTVVHT